jgi:hypothetical protein
MPSTPPSLSDWNRTGHDPAELHAIENYATTLKRSVTTELAGNHLSRLIAEVRHLQASLPARHAVIERPTYTGPNPERVTNWAPPPARSHDLSPDCWCRPEIVAGSRTVMHRMGPGETLSPALKK